MLEEKSNLLLEKGLDNLAKEVKLLRSEVSELKIHNNNTLNISQLQEVLCTRDTQKHRYYMRSMITICVILLFLLWMTIYLLAE